MKLVVDTDPGVDDVMAILMAFASPELEILGLTTVFGNAGIEHTTTNALTLLETCGRTEIPVAKGAAEPIASSYLGPVPQVHGTNGLGDAALRGPSCSPIAHDAADFIYTTAAAQPGEVTILALGPLTNVATAIRRYPDLPAWLTASWLWAATRWCQVTQPRLQRRTSTTIPRLPILSSGQTGRW